MAYEYDNENGFQPEQPKPPRQQPPKKDNDVGSWIFIAIMFAVWWPIGLIMLLSKLSEGGGKKKNVRTYAPSQTGQRTSQRVGQSAQAEKARSAVQQMTRTPEYTDKGGRTMRIIGAILGILGCMALFSAVGDNLSYAYHYNEWWYFLRQLFYPLGMLAGGASLLLGSGMLFRSQAAATAYFDKARQMQQPEEPAVQPQAAEGYAGVLRQIRELNDRIADEALSAKIDRIEQVSGRIFKAIEDDPAKKGASGTFLNYYLPTTLRLLENYADFEETGVSGENLSQAKSRIEATMDSIVVGFEHQLDELYRTDAMDIDSDIRVMETMLRRDTASVADDFGLGGAAAQRQSEEE